MRIHDELTVELTPTPINRKTSNNPTEIFENYIETITNDQDDENVYEIDPVITWETLQKYRECESFNVIMDKFERIQKQRFSPGFWNSKVSHKLYMFILRIKLGMHTMERLYTITRKDFSKNHGCGLLSHKYNDSPNVILTSLYPKHENLKMFSAFKGKRPNGIPTVEYWHDDNPKTPQEVFMNTQTKYKFNCDACPHIFSSRLGHIVNGHWCPYCANRALCEKSLTCPTCLPKTFHSFEGKRPNGIPTVEYWHEDNHKKPHEEFMNSDKKYKFNCDACPHIFSSRLGNIVRGHWCPYCSNPPKKLCDDTLSCQSCLKKTFHSFDGKTPYGNKVLDCWNKENHKKPHEVFMCSGTKYKFNCDACPDIFSSALCDVVTGSWCPTCKNKTEKLVLEFLQNKFSKKDVKRQFKHEKVKNIRELPFDICLLPHKIIIEVDGMQHFKNHCHFKSHAVEQCERDCKKMKIIFEEGYSVIRIVQQEVWFEKTRDVMLNKLKESIQECINSDFPIIRYVSMDENIYMNHKQLLSENKRQ